MATPSQKSPEMDNFLDHSTGRRAAIHSDECVVCRGPAQSFRDNLSEKEYTISGMCQNCQDIFFGTGDE